ncbi:hypothetical protein M072_3809 [Bacteroides fragilis str. DS-208]|nr:hypothetical protein M072_3809 [Bacteroides fragilis str. DS-208]
MYGSITYATDINTISIKRIIGSYSNVHLGIPQSYFPVRKILW